MSKVSPRYFIDIAEHSMCHPGRPRPSAVSHAGSVALPGSFHSAKSRASSFGKRANAIVDRTVGLVGVLRLEKPLNQSHHLGNMTSSAGDNIGSFAAQGV